MNCNPVDILRDSAPGNCQALIAYRPATSQLHHSDSGLLESFFYTTPELFIIQRYFYLTHFIQLTFTAIYKQYLLPQPSIQLVKNGRPPPSSTDTIAPPSQVQHDDQQQQKPIPITILTGFLGAGKTTLILNLLPQLRALNPNYTLALLKNEFGDLAVDSQLATSSSISSVKELLNGCICCNLVGSLSSALKELKQTAHPDRVIIETSGSAFPATLAMEVNRLVRETKGKEWVLDGVVSVIDVENWGGYEDTSFTARLQARYTDLVVLNKWEGCGERRVEEVEDRLGDLEVDTARVRSERGRVGWEVLLGLDGGLAGGLGEQLEGGGHEHKHDHGHREEVEVLSVELRGDKGRGVDAGKLMGWLGKAPKDEVYRIKAVLTVGGGDKGGELRNSDEDVPVGGSESGRYILNWAFGRWTFTPMGEAVREHESSLESTLRMTVVLARYESNKWKKKLEAGGLVELEGGGRGELVVKKIN
ncbi:CobW/HypB/UreG, nucleotide-binding domain-containing protein [Apiosordaria backusii]|uniref:CobW/HypB/UreG, nucleotide-binding domain-containing protein n=1 Tax=Apiosordaria backusii TaxID=314023 RepID=A0AA40EIP6_9PEZI|nr:CobW/HypB/UreG, nucleotide-binding domain-containing protein [Apiosordaria backusii]